MARNARKASLAQHAVPHSLSDDVSVWSFQTPFLSNLSSAPGNSRLSNGLSDLDSDISLAADWENHHLLQSTQGTTQQEASRTPEFQDLNLDSLQYDDDELSCPLDGKRT